MKLYGRCRRLGECTCGLCAKIRAKYQRELSVPGASTWLPPADPTATVPGLKKTLICSYHTGRHRNSCYGYPAGQRHDIPPEARIVKKYLCPGGGLINECEWTGSRYEYTEHWKQRHAVIPTPIPLRGEQ